MNEDDVRQVIKEELANFLKVDRYVFDKNIQILNARNFQLGRGTGTKIGTEGGSSGQKLGLWGTTPITQPSAISDPGNAGVNYAQGEAQDTVDQLKAILDALQATGIIQT